MGARVSAPFELEAMATAHRYQEWVMDTVRPFLGYRILEVGSGIGTMTRHLAEAAPTVATDVDRSLLAQLRENSTGWPTPPVTIDEYDIINGPRGLPWLEGIDTVVSFNVLEHIPDDRGAVRGMVEVLRCGGSTGLRRIVIFVPAHQWAHGGIDQSFEHYRRYSAHALRQVIRSVLSPSVRPRIRYFNTLGLLGWFLMGRVLRRRSFGAGSVQTMERLIPIYRRLDPLLHGRVGLPLGQSLLCVAEVR